MDFSNAFVQAKLKRPVWVHLPRGFSSQREGTCLKLLRSLYGAVFSPRLWYQHLTKIIIELGFHRSSLDPCLLLKVEIYLIFHVDDMGIGYKNEKAIENLILSLKRKD